MQTECSTTLFEFAPVEDRKVVAGFDGGTMSSNAGALLLGGADKAVKLVERVAQCFVDRRNPALIEHSVATLVGQRIFGLALGYEDLNDHDALRHDPLFAVLAGKLKARRADCANGGGQVGVQSSGAGERGAQPLSQDRLQGRGDREAVG